MRSPDPQVMTVGCDPRQRAGFPTWISCSLSRTLPDPMRRNALPLFVPGPAIKELHLPYRLARGEAVYAGKMKWWFSVGAQRS
jgi:hypothetical protein